MKLSFKEKIGYSVGELAGSSLWQTMMFFLPVFYTDIFGISAAAAGTLFLVVRIFDALNDPIMGSIADRTKSRWGKFRPYLLFGSFPLGMLTVLMFTTPDFSEPGKLIWAYSTYFMLLVLYTIVMVPFNSLIGVMSPNPLERVSLSSYKFVAAYSAGIFVQALLIPMVEKLGQGNEARGYQLAMGIIAIMGVTSLLVAFFTTRERVLPDPEAKKTLKTDFADLFSNRPWVVLFAISIIFLIYIGVRSASVMYYFEYYIGRKDLASVFMVSGTLAVLLGVLPTKYLSVKLGKKRLFIISMFVIAGSLITNYFAAPDDIILIFGTQILFSLASGPSMPLLWSMLADSADYGEWKTGRRTTGLIYSAITFGQKTGVAVGAAFMLYVIGAFGYIANQMQLPGALTGMRLCMTLIPAAICLVGTGILFYYNLNEKTLEKIEKDLAERRSSAK